ncbi:hypothetical protein [Gaiella sp.]|jgi:uncharacterized spore protein YtfJ|uniref:hypothetical protein n=1 Tax=Gaiella sp. TaxID=2663207 RepID=UPI002E367E1A|nr:hypothetical protein [Gaiella sp.]HEX5585205.1 hypothetical protein [Gaiella sp.]
MNVDELLGGVRDSLRAQMVFGEPIERDGTTVVPAAVVRGGGGGGGDSEHNGGGGFGVQARPAGAFVIRDGDVAWRPAVDVDRIARGALAAFAGLVVLRMLVGPRR